MIDFKNMDYIAKMILLEEYISYYVDTKIYNIRMFNLVWGFLEDGFLIKNQQVEILSFEEWFHKNIR